MISATGRLSEKFLCSSSTLLPSHTIVDISGTELSKYQMLNSLSLCSSADRKFREESAKLLSYLIRKCERLILPYIVPIHKV
ncbi:serine/threonine-protein kinase tor [Quercus suber]|uniref:Serine/threonine-protein kinase tor n=1 Tax=Quercus suber TaxID=58331 RepID=A0AAW0L302_QUESU